MIRLRLAWLRLARQGLVLLGIGLVGWMGGLLWLIRLGCAWLGCFGFDMGFVCLSWPFGWVLGLNVSSWMRWLALVGLSLAWPLDDYAGMAWYRLAPTRSIYLARAAWLGLA